MDFFDGDVSVSFWSADSRTIYFNEGIKATNQLLALDVDRGTVRQITNEKASLTVARDDDSGVLYIIWRVLIFRGGAAFSILQPLGGLFGLQ